MPEKTKLENEIEVYRIRSDLKLRNTRIRFILDGYDIDTVIMSLDNYSKYLNSEIKKILGGDRKYFYTETVNRYYSAKFLRDYLMEQAGKAILKERKKQKEQKEKDNEKK